MDRGPSWAAAHKVVQSQTGLKRHSTALRLILQMREEQKVGEPRHNPGLLPDSELVIVCDSCEVTIDQNCQLLAIVCSQLEYYYTAANDIITLLLN